MKLMFLNIKKTLTILCVLAVTACGAEEKLCDFSSGNLSGWAFSIGSEFPGAHGNLWVEEKGGEKGKAAACLAGEFNKGGNYVSMSSTFESPLDIVSVDIKLKSGTLRSMVLRFTDSTGQTFQQSVNLKNSANWQTVSISSFSGKAHWGGNNDGVWRGPAKAMSIIVDKQNISDSSDKRALLFIESVRFKIK